MPSFQIPSPNAGEPNKYPQPPRLHVSKSTPDVMPSFPHQQTYITNFLQGTCAVFRKKAIDQAGDYDALLTPTQNEDIDYGVSIRAQGYDLIVRGKVIALHYSNNLSRTSYNLTLGIGYKTTYYLHKWGRALEILETALDRDGRIIEQ